MPTAAGTQGRNFYTQARTAPGVSLSTKAHQPFSVSGQRAINNNYLIDSVDNNDPNAGLIAGRGANEQLISQEAIQSFEVLTHNFKAEYGRNSGGIVSINNNRLLDLPGTLVRCGSCATPIQLTSGVTKAQLTPAAGALGTLGRNSQRTDGLVDIAFSLSKDFRVTERLRVQLRGELFNAFNVANFNAVDNVLVSSNFGRYTSAFDPRRAQLVARVIF